MKKCGCCKIKKALSDFHVCKTTKDGRRSICKVCRNSKTRKYYRENRFEISVKNKGRWKNYYELDDGTQNLENVEKRRLRNRCWKLENRKKVLAHKAVEKAIKHGLLKRGECEVCGDYETEGHHENYNEPLIVMWLCRKHHNEKHSKILKELKANKGERHGQEIV